MIVWKWDDGGRAAAGFKGTAAGDCAVRAAAIATGHPYQEVYDDIIELAQAERPAAFKRRRGGRSHPRTGVWTPTMHKLMVGRYGWEWTPTMHIGSGCTVHVRADELPAGPLILNLSRHYAAVIDGVLYDTHDSSRDGTRCVYGHWRPATAETYRTAYERRSR